MKEKALMIFESICMSYELPKGLTKQQEEDLLWNQFVKHGFGVTRDQLIEWINENQSKVYNIQFSDEGFAVSDLPKEGTWKLVAAEGKTMKDFMEKQPIKVKVNG